MRIEDFARYVDAIAPINARADTPDVGRVERGRRTSPTSVLATIAGVAAVALVVVVLVVVSTSSNQAVQLSTEPGDTAPTSVATGPTTTSIAPSGGLTVDPPVGPTITVDLTEEVGLDADELLVIHQVGFTIGTYGYDLTVYETQAVPFDPCGRIQPCTEVVEPFTNAAGLVVRSWAPTLLPGAEPTSPTVYTVEAPSSDSVLTIPATFAGAPLRSDELAQSVSYDAGAGTFTATQQSERHELTWSATMFQPLGADGGEWIVNVTPSCDGADRCESGVGLSSLPPPSGDRRPIDALVRSVTVVPPN